MRLLCRANSRPTTFMEGVTGLVPGRIAAFVTLVILWGVMLINIRRALGGNLPVLREIPALKAIEEAIGRATETGRPVLFTSGLGDVTDANGPQTIAGLEILGSVAETTASLGTNLICTVCKPNLQPITEAIVKQAYSNAGKPDAYRPDMVRFCSPDQMAYAAATAGIIEREKVAASIMVGAYWQEAMMLAEAGAAVKAIQIGGTARMIQLPFFVIACDYTLIGEEIYAGGAYLSKHPMRLGSLAGQDIGKVIAVAVAVVGALLTSFGSKYLTTLLGK